jgi:flagellar biosynthetic protein FlhB
LICLAGVAVNVLQVGFLFLPQRLAFDFSRLDPLQGLRRIFSSSGMVQLGFGMLKLTIVLAVAGAVLYNDRAEILRLTELSPAGIGVQISQILFRTAIKVGAALFVLALLDYAYQWWRHEQDMKMTPQELREELRNLEGNPQVIARRKQVQRDLAVKSGEWRVSVNEGWAVYQGLGSSLPSHGPCLALYLVESLYIDLFLV